MNSDYFREYVTLSGRTEPISTEPIEGIHDELGRLIHAVLGMSTEVVELFENVTIGMNNEQNFKEELGDFMWYLALFMRGPKVPGQIELWEVVQAAYDGVLNKDWNSGEEPDTQESLEASVCCQGYMLDSLKRAIYYHRPGVKSAKQTTVVGFVGGAEDGDDVVLMYEELVPSVRGLLVSVLTLAQNKLGEESFGLTLDEVLKSNIRKLQVRSGTRTNLTQKRR